MTQPSMDARWQPPSLGLRAGGRLLTFERPLIMGVVNVTPNSFSQGHTTDVAAAVAHGLALVRAGADILDIGGEATNPRAAPVTAEEELVRVLPVIERLMARCDAVLSIDTTKAAVARAAVAAGATMVNDVSGGRFDPDMLGTMAELAAAGRAAYVAGHLRGQSISEVFAAEAQAQPGDWRQVVDELAAQVAALPPSMRQVTLVDPCLGFGKGAGPLNLQLLRCGRELTAATGCPALIGPSRKRFLRQAAGLAGDGARQQGLASSWRPHHQ
ncbi:MAG TPA: dihydropteroate synthase, partial [Kofleriaceae bacterium]|nr:dihydropteroate synthase [Kofleriaceae bacterium]